MNWNTHSELKGSHAIMSASQPYWLNDSDDKFIERFNKFEAAARGTRLHDSAARDILFGQEFNILRPANGRTYETYVNDAIKYRMRPEQILYYSQWAFGTADAISFRRNLLRIHDLKTGHTPVKIEQLYIYAALFCLEYHHKPGQIKIELRIYQNDQVNIWTPTAMEIAPIMDIIIKRTVMIQKYLNMEEI